MICGDGGTVVKFCVLLISQLDCCGTEETRPTALCTADSSDRVSTRATFDLILNTLYLYHLNCISLHTLNRSMP